MFGLRGRFGGSELRIFWEVDAKIRSEGFARLVNVLERQWIVHMVSERRSCHG